MWDSQLLTLPGNNGLGADGFEVVMGASGLVVQAPVTVLVTVAVRSSITTEVTTRVLVATR